MLLAYLLLEQQDDVVVRLIGSVQVHHAWVVARHLQHGHLVHHLRPAVSATPALLQDFGGEHFACGLLPALLHHSKFAPDTQGRNKKKKKRKCERKEEKKRKGSRKEKRELTE